MGPRSAYSNRRIAVNNSKTQIGRNIDHYDGKRGATQIGAGDSYYEPHFIKTRRECDDIFHALLQEVDFQQMFMYSSSPSYIEGDKSSVVDPIPRMVSAQCSYDQAQRALYRMPGCNEKNIPTTPWTDTVKYVRDKLSEHLGQDFNHCVVTLFRDEEDSLGFHKDKILDLDDNSVIVSVSFGAERPILFHSATRKALNKTRGKFTPRPSRQEIKLRAGSILAIGPHTNRDYTHAIPKLSDAVGPRISLSFRTCKSFIRTTSDGDHVEICGKGKAYQCADYPDSVASTVHEPHLIVRRQALLTGAMNRLAHLRQVAAQWRQEGKMELESGFAHVMSTPPIDSDTVDRSVDTPPTGRWDERLFPDHTRVQASASDDDDDDDYSDSTCSYDCSSCPSDDDE